MQVTLIFELNEDVTPHLFAQKVAMGCSALRKGESVIEPISGQKVTLTGKSMLEAMGGWPPK